MTSLGRSCGGKVFQVPIHAVQAWVRILKLPAPCKPPLPLELPRMGRQDLVSVYLTPALHSLGPIGLRPSHILE